MAGLFDFLNDINIEKTDMVLHGDDQTRKELDLFMLRRGLAQNLDTVLIAQKMNRIHYADPWLNWCLAFHSVVPKKRYAKWAKKTELDAQIKALSDYFYISIERASEYIQFLPKTAVEEILEKISNSDKNEKAKPKRTKTR